jgi:hypothetical protein
LKADRRQYDSTEIMGTWRCPTCRVEGVQIMDAPAQATAHAKANPGHRVTLLQRIDRTTEIRYSAPAEAARRG